MSNTIPEEFRRVVEIEGVKVEVDLRTAKKVDTYRVGDAIRVLVKSYSGWDTHPGVITVGSVEERKHSDILTTEGSALIERLCAGEDPRQVEGVSTWEDHATRPVRLVASLARALLIEQRAHSEVTGERDEALTALVAAQGAVVEQSDLLQRTGQAIECYTLLRDWVLHTLDEEQLRGFGRTLIDVCDRSIKGEEKKA